MNKKYNLAIKQFDTANNDDPRKEVFEGTEYPKELLYAQRMTQWLDRIEPDASEPVRLAARSQHICRWMIPRDHYPMDRRGYRKWRTDLGKFHAEKAGRILHEIGYDEKTIYRVQSLLRKEKLKTDPDMQLLEDVICLVFLESYFSDFANQHDEEKLVKIIQKTWKKMSSRGHDAALKLELSSAAQTLINKALEGIE